MIKRASLWVGLVAVFATAIGCTSIPQLFQLCTSGEISGPPFVGMVLALATSLVAGVRLIFVKKARGRSFILAALLFGLSFHGVDQVFDMLSLKVAALAPLLGTVFFLSRSRQKEDQNSIVSH